jgi:PAS domain S-box-containing protein
MRNLIFWALACQLAFPLYDLNAHVYQQTRDERMLESILRSAPTGIGVVEHRVVVEVNDYILKLTGYSREELIGKSARIFYPSQEEYDYVGDEKYRQISAYGTGSVETRWQHKDGSIRYVILSSTPLQPNNLAAGVTFTVLDITERKLAQMLLEETEERFVKIFRSSPGPLVVSDIESGLFIDVNDSWLQMLEYTREEMMGRTSKEVGIWKDPVDRDRLIVKIKAQGYFEDEPIRFITKSGRDVYALWSAEIILLDGKQAMLSLILDETERYYAQKLLRSRTKWFFTGLIAFIVVLILLILRLKKGMQQLKSIQGALRKSEKMYRVIFDGSSNGILAANKDTLMFTYSNPAICSMFGYTREEFMKLKVTDLHPSDSLDHIMSEFSLLAEGVKTSSYSIPCLSKEGKLFYADITANNSTINDLNHIVAFFIDVTDRIEAEKALAASQRMLLEVIDTIPVRVFWKDKEARYLGCNKLFAMDAGRDDPDSMIGQDDFQMGWADQAQLYRADDFVVMNSGIPKINFEESQTTPDGRKIWLQTSKIPLRDEKGNIYGVLGTYEDITERKDAVEELQQERTRLAGIIEGTNVGTWEWNVQTGETIFNERWAEIIGYSLEEIAPVSIQTWMKFAHPDDLKSSNELLQSHFNGDLPYYQFEGRMKHKDGSWVWVMDRGKVIQWTQDGKPLMMMGTHQDITRQKKDQAEIIRAREEAIDSEKKIQKLYYELQTSEEELRSMNEELKSNSDALYKNFLELEIAKEKAEESEEKHRLLFENMIQGVVYHDAEGRVIYANQSAADILGISMDQLLGKTSMDPRWRATDEHGNALGGEGHPDRITLRTGEPVKDFLMRVSVPECLDYRWININSIPVFRGDGKTPHQVIVTFEDVTARRQAEEETRQRENLEKKIAVAEESLRFKQNFLANMSHEIRTPLTGILGMADILIKTPLDKDQKDFVQTIQRSGESLREIINDVLDFSKIEAGQVRLRKRVFAWKQIVENAQKLFLGICKNPVSYSYVAPPDFPEFIRADQSRITQVINNLISNAVKFTPQGDITLRAEVLTMDRETGIVEIKVWVADTGVGISSDKFTQLFQPFSQVDDSDVRQTEGTGLGLSICKELVELHGGEIGAESNPGGGTTFWFTFIAHKATLGGIPDEKKEMRAEKAENLNILLAEDKEVNQKVIKLLLLSMGHEVTIAANGQIVLDIYQPDVFDLILMDIQMPVMDGITATMKLREKYNSLPPVIGLSANAFEGDREKYMNKGLDEYITKPFRKEDFLVAVAKIFGSNPSD